MKTRHIVLLAGALLMATPAITTLSGCGGGGNGISIGNQSINNLPIVFGNGQTGSLDIGIVNRAITATLRVAAAPAVAAATGPKAITITIPTGTYVGTGTVNSSGQFTITFDSPDPVPDIVITGTIPTTSSTGSYTVTINGQSVSGTFPSLGQATPTPTGTGTPTPTGTAGPTPTVTPLGDRISGTITGKTNTNVTDVAFNMPLKASTVRNTAPRIFSAIYEDRSGTLFRSIALEVIPTANLAAGQSYSLSDINVGSFSYFEATNANPGGTAKNWDSVSGTLRIDSVSGDIVRFTVLNARLQARTGSISTGSFTITGSGQARTSFGTAG